MAPSLPGRDIEEVPAVKSRTGAKKTICAVLAAASVLLASGGAWAASDEDVFRYRAYPNMLIVLNRSASMATALDNSTLDLDGDTNYTRFDLALKALFRVLNADGTRNATDNTTSPNYAADVPSYRSFISVGDELYLAQRIGALWYDNTVHRSTVAPYQVLSPPTTPNQPPYGNWAYLNVWDSLYALNGSSPLHSSGTTAEFPKNDIVSYCSYATSNPAADDSASCRPKVVLLITDGSDVSGATLADVVLDNTYSMFVLGVGVNSAGDRNRLRRLITRETGTAVNNTADETGGEGRIAFFYSADDVENSAIFQNMVAQLQSSTFEFVAPVVPAVRTSDSNLLFIASFSPAGSGAASSLWPGHLRSYNLATDGSIPDTLVQNWDASTRLGYMASSARKIYTSVGGVRKNFLLNASSGVTASNLGVADDTVAAGVISKVRGLGLGDIFHSTPVLVGNPSLYYMDLSGHAARQDFATSNAHRRRIIVAGANDGMLHAFDAGVWNSSASPPGYTVGYGDEVWSYIPGFLLGNVKDFFFTPATHRYYVDNPAAVADIWIDSNSDHLDAHLASEWHTYLIGGAGKGGNGYFALDITDPADPKVKWELTSDNTAVLGKTFSTPAIGKMKKITTKMVDGKSTDFYYDLWVAIVGAGKASSAGTTTLTALTDLTHIHNPYTVSVGSTGDAPSSGQITMTVTVNEIKKGKPVTSTYTSTGTYTSKTGTTFQNVNFISASDRYDYPAGTTLVSWGGGTEGKAILVLDAGSGQILQTLTSSNPGMGEVVAQPALVTNELGYIERFYVGDLDGNLWRGAIDNTANFSLGGRPFFTIGGSTYSKKIHGKASVAKGSYAYPYWWIYFGTGDREDPMGGGTGAVFGVFEDQVIDKRAPNTNNITESDLTDWTTFFANIADTSTPFPTLDTGTQGWFASLPVVAEKMLSTPTVFNNNLFFTTFEPNTGFCSIGGTARVYGFGIAPGYNAGSYALFSSSSASSADKRVFTFSNVGIPSSPVVSMASGGVATMYFGTTGSDVKALKIPSPPATKSIRYWKEVF
jgi:Tfp pilus tip-associated adhesin PilY1